MSSGCSSRVRKGQAWLCLSRRSFSEGGKQRQCLAVPSKIALLSAYFYVTQEEYAEDQAVFGDGIRRKMVP